MSPLAPNTHSSLVVHSRFSDHRQCRWGGNKTRTNKRVHWSNSMDEIHMTDGHSCPLVGLSPSEQNKYWYNQDDFDSIVKYNKELVEYATQSVAPKTEEDWSEFEYELNRHGHSLRGLESYEGMPHAEMRCRKRERAKYGLFESIQLFGGDEEKVAMAYSQISQYSLSVALEAGKMDALFVLRYASKLSHTHSQNHDFRNVRLPSRNKQRRRKSLPGEIVKTIRRMPRRLSLISRS
mmetsp:Transcript_18329/g.23767  ORF Transcript_18329/g.23767 Transcript_18329/m.23767 type:complete len:236 (+) Transcript_18329:71-778(+)